MICLMSKMDLIKTSGGGTGKGIRGQHKIGKEIGRYLDPDPMLLLEDINQETNPKFHALNQAVVDLVRPTDLVLAFVRSLIYHTIDTRPQHRLISAIRCDK